MTRYDAHEPTSLSIRGVTLDSRTPTGTCFLVLAAGFQTVVTRLVDVAHDLAAAMVPGYDVRGAAIGDLGTVPETALPFNAVLVLVGVLNLAGGSLLSRTRGERWLLTVFALLAFVSFDAQALGTATRLRGPVRVVSVLVGGVGLVFVVLMALGDAGDAAAFGPIGHGDTERMIVSPVMFWPVAFGGSLLATGESRDSVRGSA